MPEIFKRIFPIVLILIIAWLILRSGISGPLYYDDFRPLSNLVTIQDISSAFEYITTETSGPLGRPISMLTFALQADAWPDKTENFFIFNILLHISSGVLLYILSLKIFQIVNKTKSHHLPALLIFTIWVFSPINISTYLIAIQRMAGLSGFFTLLGLLLYVIGLMRASNNEKNSLALQFAGLVVCTVLAVLSKENGMLLPVLALCIEKFLYKRADKYQKLRLAYLYSVLFIIISYLVYYAASKNGIYPNRDFTVFERLLTQPYIILSYLKLALIPDIFAYNPFHDDLSAFSFQTLTPLSILSLVIVLFAPVIAVKCRNRHPFISFAIAWFLAAHLLESSVVGLELYFEHRNYIAVIGPLMALAYYLNAASLRYRKLIVTGTVSYVLLIIVLTGYIVSVWGRPIVAAEAWFDKQFGSPRAAEHLALLYLENNRTMEAYFTLQAQVKACPDCIGSRIQYALLSCVVNDTTSMQENINEVIKIAPKQKMIGSAPSALSSLSRQIENGNCKHLTYSELYEINSILLQHQREEINASNRFALLINLHNLTDKLGRQFDSLSYLQQAYDIRYDFTLGNVIFNQLMEMGNIKEASEFFETSLCNPKTSNIIVKRRILKQCEAIRLQHFAAEQGEENVD